MGAGGLCSVHGSPVLFPDPEAHFSTAFPQRSNASAGTPRAFRGRSTHRTRCPPELSTRFDAISSPARVRAPSPVVDDLAPACCVWQSRAMQIAVSCRCGVSRKLDTEKVGPWRIRCTTCREIIYDPARAKPPLAPPPEPEVTDSDFTRWLTGSAELKVLLSSDGDGPAGRCPAHGGRKFVAACVRCSRLLCRACLDQVGEAFTCAECVRAELEERAGTKRGIGGFLARLFGRA